MRESEKESRSKLAERVIVKCIDIERKNSQRKKNTELEERFSRSYIIKMGRSAGERIYR